MESEIRFAECAGNRKLKDYLTEIATVCLRAAVDPRPRVLDTLPGLLQLAAEEIAGLRAQEAITIRLNFQ